MAVMENAPAQKQLPGWDGRSHRLPAFIAGAVAGMAMSMVMLILILTGTTPRSVPGLVADKIAAVAGAGVTEFFIQRIGALGKEMLFLSVIIGMVVVGGLLGLLFGQLTGRTRRRSEVWRNSLIMSTAFWLIFVTVGMLLLDVGLLGSTLKEDQIPFLVISFLQFSIFGVIFGYGYMLLVPTRLVQTIDPALNEEHTELVRQQYTTETIKTRRQFVGIVSAGFILLVGAAIGSQAFKNSGDYWTTLGLMLTNGSVEGEITPSDTFYQVSKNTFNPKVDGATWQLKINGMVNSTPTFNMADIKALPMQRVYHTLTCISNEVGGMYIGNAEWTGVPLRTLIEKAGVKGTPKRVAFTCADGYTDSIDFSKAMEADTIFALEQNGAPLTNDHGFPGRMLIPNIYGMKNAKWVTEITLVDEENYFGFWQQQGWDNLAEIRSHSTITTPTDGDSVKAGTIVSVRGFAYAGTRNIEKVEVSLDDGATWQNASFGPRKGNNSWTLWHYDWTPAAGQSKVYSLRVRCTEENGVVQVASREQSFPAGASGYHRVMVRATL